MQDNLTQTLLTLFRENANLMREQSDRIIRQNDTILEMISYRIESENAPEPSPSPQIPSLFTNARNSRTRNNRHSTASSSSSQRISSRGEEYAISLEVLNGPAASNFDNVINNLIERLYTTINDSSYNAIVSNGIPSDEEINAKCRRSLFSDVEFVNQPTCPISLDHFTQNDRILEIIQCGHIFKEDQLRQHFTLCSTCPICRFDILSEN